jgi:hypothetical protein
MGARCKFLAPARSVPTPKRPPALVSHHLFTAAHPSARRRHPSPPPPPPHWLTPLPFPVRPSTTAAPLHHLRPRHPLVLHRPFELRLPPGHTERGLAPTPPPSAPVHHRFPWATSPQRPQPDPAAPSRPRRVAPSSCTLE